MMIRIHQVIDTMIHESKVEKSLIKCRNYVFHYINLSCVSKKTNHHFHHGEEINFKALVHVLNSACTSFILITLIHFSFEYLIVFFVSFSHPDQCPFVDAGVTAKTRACLVPSSMPQCQLMHYAIERGRRGACWPAC